MYMTEDQIEQLKFYNGRISTLLDNPQPELKCWTTCLIERITQSAQVLVGDPPQRVEPPPPGLGPFLNSLVESQAEMYKERTT